MRLLRAVGIRMTIVLGGVYVPIEMLRRNGVCVNSFHYVDAGLSLCQSLLFSASLGRLC